MKNDNDEKEKRWSGYIEKTKDKLPSKLLIEALSFVGQKSEALELGSGAFNDTKFLLEQGFRHITAVDKFNPIAQELYHALLAKEERVEYVISLFENFDFPEEVFDLVNAQYSLPFTRPDAFDGVFEKVKNSLAVGGVFTGQLFGKNHEWNVKDSAKSFHLKEEVKKLLQGMEVLKCKEREEDKKPRVGDKVIHWHFFDIIAKKNTI
jgi:SAM-dependent methyltransferase